MAGDGTLRSTMHQIHATFVDHAEAESAVTELRDGLGLVDVDVAPLAAVDPPLADPVVVDARVADEDEPIVRDLLRAHGAAVVSHATD